MTYTANRERATAYRCVLDYFLSGLIDPNNWPPL